MHGRRCELAGRRGDLSCPEVCAMRVTSLKTEVALHNRSEADYEF